MSEREELMAKLEAAFPVIDEMYQYEEDIKRRPRKSGGFVMGIIGMVLLAISSITMISITLTGIFTFLPEIYSTYDTEHFLTAILAFAIVLVFICFVCLIPFVLYFAIYVRRRVKRNKKAKIAPKKIAELKNDPLLSFLPMKYRDPASYVTIYEILECGKADTLKEAMLRCDDELHKEYMQTMARISAIR